MIEEKSNYLQKFESGNDFCFFKEFLRKRELEKPSGEGSSVLRMLYALATNETSELTSIIEDNSAKYPTEDSPYIYKDLQVFLFICVTKKFSLSHDWIIRFVENRKSAEPEKNAITKTFRNLLSNNLDSTDNLFEIVIVYKNIIGSEETNETFLNETYEKLSNMDFPFYNSDFLNLVALKSIDFIVTSKELTSFRDSKHLRTFAEKFDKRINQVAISIFCFIAFLLFLPLFYVGYKLFYGTPEESELANKILTVSAIVITFFAFIGYSNRNDIIGFFKTQLNKFFGRGTPAG